MSDRLALRPAWLSRSRDWGLALALLLFGLALYLPFRSASLDDFDSYSFALALEHFDLTLQQPQPPGFPVYVFLGRLFQSLTGEARTALTLLSALSGVALILLVYALGRALYARQPGAAVAATWLVALAPMGWLTAEKALSDTPGLALTVLAVWLLWRGQEESRSLLLGGLVTGLALGLRPQNALPILLLLVYLALGLRRRWRRLLAPGVLVLLGIGLWLVPTFKAAGGAEAYLTRVRDHASHLGETDSFLAGGQPALLALRTRALAFGDTFFTYTAGASLSAPPGLLNWLRLAVPALLLLVGLAWASWRRPESWFLLLWALAVTVQAFVLEAPDRPRLLLPILPPLALLVAHGWTRAWPRAAPFLFAGLALGLLLQGAPLAAQLANEPAPPERATVYVAERYPASETLLVSAGSFRAVQAQLPAYRHLYLYGFDSDAARAAGENGVKYIVIFDRDQFYPAALEALGAGEAYLPLEDRTFARDWRIHTQHDQVRVQVLAARETMPDMALALPGDGCIDVGGEGDGRYLLQGWFRPEEIGGVRGRWAGDIVTSTVQLYVNGQQPRQQPQEKPWRLAWRALPFAPEQEVTLLLAGEEIAHLSLAPAWSEYEVPLALPAGGMVTLQFVHRVVISPQEATGGGSVDHRPLSAAYDWICLRGEE